MSLYFFTTFGSQQHSVLRNLTTLPSSPHFLYLGKSMLEKGWTRELLLFTTTSSPSLFYMGKGASGFYVVEDTDEGARVNRITQEVLQSYLTTVFLPVVYIIIFIVGLPTNAMAIWVFLFRTKEKHPASILMANLALADLLFIIWLPLKISYHFNGNNWIFGDALCKVLVGFFYGNMYCSTIFIACISVQRYWTVAHPLSRKQKLRTTVCVCVCVWIVVWLITAPLYMYEQAVNVLNMNLTTCHDVTRPSQSSIPSLYFLTMGTVGYIIPCVVCIVAYVFTFQSLGKSVSESGSNKKKKKAMVLMITVLVMFLVCFTPSNIMLMVHYSLLNAGIQNNVYGFYIVALCLCSLNSCLDPFVYYFISEEFRQNVKNTLICRSERTAKRMEVSSTPLKSSRETTTLSET
ncbi:proteinase-activated receptor 2-like [Hoplias malabaricus]|uniref:proteinase-activated receptor 2-like n=1 Tax=Hoplias malabaricus TaxID=27720 RepID=UPI003461D181